MGCWIKSTENILGGMVVWRLRCVEQWRQVGWLAVASAALVDLEAVVEAAVGSGCGRGSRRRGSCVEVDQL